VPEWQRAVAYAGGAVGVVVELERFASVTLAVADWPLRV
jgi:hypothetical protein